MKTLKKIHLGTQFTPNQMIDLLGGANHNGALFCECSGGNSYDFCNDNSNYSMGCSCEGDKNNTNNGILCSCS